MDLNLKQKSLSFTLNSAEQGVAFNNIETRDDIQYRLAVSLLGSDCKVSIEDHRIIPIGG